MISSERIKNIKEVYYHASCPDGTSSAMIVATAFRSMSSHPKFIPIQYTTNFFENMEAKPDQLFVDITPPSNRWEEWKEFNPIVLDHHISSKHITEGLNGIYRDNETHSGAKLALDFILEPMFTDGFIDLTSSEYNKWVDFANIAMIRDTWKNHHKDWELACDHARAMSFFGSKVLVEKALNSNISFEEIFRIGGMLSESTQKRVELIAKSSYKTVISDGIRDYKVAIFNSSEKLISDVGDYLINNHNIDIVVSYFYLFEDDEHIISVSLRSNGSAKVNSIAKRHGGGGHDKAAGFTIKDAFYYSPQSILSFVKSGLTIKLD